MNSLIVPPPEVRNVIDKTSSFVPKNGPAFEERIYDKEKYNPKFSFLNTNDPYHGYYQMKVEDFKNGTDLISQHLAAASCTGKLEDQQEANQPLKEPKPFDFHLKHPPIPPLDLQIIKCTALYVARNGRAFMANIAQREQKNCQFDFLKNGNILFDYFSKLVEMYTKIIQKSNAVRDFLVLCSDRNQLLSSLMERVEFEACQRNELAEKEQIQRELEANASINWKEFAIVETLSFDAEAVIEREYSLPITLNGLCSIPIAEKINAFQPEAVQDKREKEQNSVFCNPIAPSTIVEESKIRSGFEDPRLKAKEQQKCPICSKNFPLDQIEEHIKGELAKSSPANASLKPVVEGESVQDEDAIAKNLDAFFSVNKNNSTKPLVTWDGTMATANSVARAAQMQVIAAATSAQDRNPSKRLREESEVQLVSNDSGLSPQVASLELPQKTSPIFLKVHLPDRQTAEKPEWNFGGKIIELSCTPKETVHELKMKIQNATAIPISRQKLLASGQPPLKNQASVESCNLNDGDSLVLGFKERGGRK